MAAGTPDPVTTSDARSARGQLRSPVPCGIGPQLTVLTITVLDHHNNRIATLARSLGALRSERRTGWTRAEMQGSTSHRFVARRSHRLDRLPPRASRCSRLPAFPWSPNQIGARAVGEGLLRISTGDIQAFGFPTFESYVREALGRTARWGTDVRGLARRLRDLPHLRAALASGRLSLSVVEASCSWPSAATPCSLSP